MDFKINDTNIDQWCFDYLESQLNEKEKMFFEQALEFDENINKEFLKWKKTQMQDLSHVAVSNTLTKTILNTNKSSFLYSAIAKVGFGIAVLGTVGFLYTKAYNNQNSSVLVTNKVDKKELVAKQVQNNKQSLPQIKKQKEKAVLILPKKIQSISEPLIQESIADDEPTDSVVKQVYNEETKQVEEPKLEAVKVDSIQPKVKRFTKKIIQTHDKL